ncbi:MAG: epimerase [Chloroflexi bacterium RBG_16_48_8]|nr:MAG: epimerase [Chloroflexi bacterium RBG_16_48_8]
MRKEVVLITGANGEIGHGLMEYLGKSEDVQIVALDIQELDEELRPYCYRFVQGDILDNMLLGRLVSEYEIRTIYHLASILSTRAEYNPEAAHRVNVEGTLNLLKLAVEQAEWQGRSVKFIYPSSIAAYGLPYLERKNRAGKVKEDEWLTPQTMYGCNKLYCEHLGRYYARYYKQLGADSGTSKIDFRCLRFPGLISAFTLPSGGTSDFGPEMLHQAAQGLPYNCFVRADACLPFMVMPDAVKSLVDLWAAPRENLNRLVYNVTSFSVTAEDIYTIVARSFPDVVVTFEPDARRQKIVDSWPSEIDDQAARDDWGWEPDYDLEQAFEEYLIPNIKDRYRSKK